MTASMIALLMLLASSLWARNDLYSGQGRLDPQSGTVNDALIQALDEVLIRLTGQVDGQPRQRLGLGVAEARALTQSQQRVSVPVVGPDGELRDELRLQVQFTPAAMNQRLAAAGMARLGPERPSALLWVAVDEGSGPQFAEDQTLDVLIGEQSRRLGLDLVRPIGDLLDLADVRLTDIRGGFLDSSNAALERYQVDIPIMLDLRQSAEGRWSARWFWRLDGFDRSANLTADSAAQLIRLGMESVLAGMAQRYAVVPDELGARRQIATVAPINDAVQYAEVLGHLQTLSMVESVRVLSARAQAVDFELILRSGGLADALALGGLFEEQQTLSDGKLSLTLAQ